jgi:hypothetical protein
MDTFRFPILSRIDVRRIGASAAVACLVLAQAGPAAAAGVVAQANATALQLTIGGTVNDSGRYTALHDGTIATSSGNNQPLITALGGQSFIQAGTLAQDAVARVEDRNGISAACAGLAGDGATLVAAGDGDCLSGGDNVNLSAATLDFSNLELVQSGLLSDVDAVLAAILEGLSPVLDGLQGALRTALSQLGAEVVLDLGAVQSTCNATRTTAVGDAGLANSGAFLSIGGETLTLLDLPAKPAPNTKVVTDLGAVVTLIQENLAAQFTSFLNGEFGAVAGVTDTVIATIVDNAIDQIAPQLAPLQENILDATLNKQVQPADNHIIVTALDLRVLPAASEFGVTLLDVEIGRTECGPNARVAPEDPDDPDNPDDPDDPETPTSVPAGAASSGVPGGALSLVVLVLLAAGSGVVAYRRLS